MLDRVATGVISLDASGHILTVDGAAERLLRSFGLSLIVPDLHYKAVAEVISYVFRLKGKIKD